MAVAAVTMAERLRYFSRCCFHLSFRSHSLVFVSSSHVRLYSVYTVYIANVCNSRIAAFSFASFLCRGDC